MDSAKTHHNNQSVDVLNSTPQKDLNNFGAAFSLASLDQGNSRGSLMNLNAMGFDHTVFLKSGSFDSLNALLGNGFGSQIFGKDSSIIASINPNIMNHSAMLPSIPQLGSSDIKNIPNITQSTNSSSPSHPSNNGINTTITPLPMNPNLKSMIPTSIPSNVISTVSTVNPTAATNAPPQQIMSYGNNALIQPKENERRIIERKDDNSKFVDVTPFLTLPQHEAAKKLGIPSSTLAKRWKEASCNRKWPYRTVSKLDKEILTLLKNVENAKSELSPSVEATLGLLLKKRQEELKTVLVRL